ncbi:RagB/SusD family nutrient uptake outer membrane protein [Flavobacterium algicola]|uniref:RagB/SusD family nutrient uptake outer membrane protein n=1 Tax=Flavobacterium algicola TaxID=556529 RepID=UPI001EFDEA95|nr:RagB/SusD family nutrient uptake outer membrane protein [Flavobacterium algicola]MCG9792325.1 RagB/SusD family nutrient uptake outer membrane protein [Flavobacterium algicola]
MKNKYIVIMLVAIACNFTISCENFLDEDPKGLLTPETFFRNEEEATMALNQLNEESVYDAGFLNHLGTDVGVSGRSVLAAAHYIGAYVYDSNTNQVINTWGTNYTVIRDANLFLASIENSPLTDQVKGNILGQILFFRANTYLQLVIQYGDIPYWRDELVDIEKISLLGKTDSRVIISEMIDDLDLAISSGYMSTDRWNQNDGRPTVWAARMLKAYCHVWLAQYDASEWAKARTELLTITTTSPHGTVLGPYADMFRGGNEYHNEIIFGKQFLANVKGSIINSTARANTAAENANTRTAMSQLDITNGSAPYTLRKSFANTFASTDTRKIYNVWESHTLTNGTVAKFNWIYIPKFVRAAVPVSDPLLSVSEASNQSSSPARLFVLSDAYLLLSEAEFMIGGSSTAALAAINKVRTRANLPNLTTMTLKDIQNERSWELVGEGYWGRKKDLIRWGILESTVIGIPALEKAAGATTTALTRAQDEADIISAAPLGKFRVYPIPLAEIQKSQDIGGALTQNPLWE